MKKYMFVAIGIIALSISACSKLDERTSSIRENSKFRNANKAKPLYHGDMATSGSAVPGSPVLDSLKNNYLELSSTKTIGEVFDKYNHAIKKEWRETTTNSGLNYIDYICWFDISPISSVSLKDGVIKRGLDIKFVVYEGGETSIVMASRIDIKSDGMLYTYVIDPPDIKKIVTAIYENREIPF